MRGLPIILAALLTAWSAEAVAQHLAVVDGDTLDVEGDRIRLWGIDAPELGTRDGQAAAAHLRSLLDGVGRGELVCQTFYFDRYGRQVARCLLAEGDDIACQMVMAGHAEDWPRYSDGYYARCEP